MMRKSTNSNVMKNKNKKLILDLIRMKRLSRSDIAQITQLTRASISLIVEPLIKEKIVSEAGLEGSGVGRKGMLLEINKNAFFAIGVNINRKAVQVGIVNLFGEVQIQDSLNLGNLKPDETLLMIDEMIKEQITELKLADDKILGVGVSTPGPVDYINGIILRPPNFDNWHNTKIVERLHQLTGLKVYLENVSNALALSEKYFGIAKNVANFMLMIVDEGVGSGIIINNAIYRGANGFGNEIGHTSIKFDGRLCECGNIGCLEKYVTMKALLENESFSSWEEIVSTMSTNDKARSLFNKETQYLVTAIVNAINLFDLDMVIIGGDISYKAEIIIAKMKEHIDKRVITGRSIEIKPIKQTNPVTYASISVINNFYT